MQTDGRLIAYSERELTAQMQVGRHFILTGSGF